MPYVLHPNGRVFPDGANFAKTSGIVRITDEEAQRILGGTITPADVTSGRETALAEAAAKKAAAEAAAKAKAAASGGGSGTTVTLSIPAETAQELQAKADAEKKAIEEAAAKNAAFGGLSKENVTLADVAACPDDQLVAFSDAVLKLTQPPGKAAGEIREQLMKIAGKQEAKRASKK